MMICYLVNQEFYSGAKHNLVDGEDFGDLGNTLNNSFYSGTSE